MNIKYRKNNNFKIIELSLEEMKGKISNEKEIELTDVLKNEIEAYLKDTVENFDDIDFVDIVDISEHIYNNDIFFIIKFAYFFKFENLSNNTIISNPI